MADFKIIPYRNNDGYIIANKKPIWQSYRVEKNFGSSYIQAVLIWCPERESLRWIGHCEECELFAGHKQYDGVRCRTRKPINAGAFYDDRTI